jgi:hypothetical protein
MLRTLITILVLAVPVFPQQGMKVSYQGLEFAKFSDGSTAGDKGSQGAKELSKAEMARTTYRLYLTSLMKRRRLTDGNGWSRLEWVGSPLGT